MKMTSKIGRWANYAAGLVIALVLGWLLHGFRTRCRRACATRSGRDGFNAHPTRQPH